VWAPGGHEIDFVTFVRPGAVMGTVANDY
jgi:hypothetical protein